MIRVCLDFPTLKRVIKPQLYDRYMEGLQWQSGSADNANLVEGYFNIIRRFVGIKGAKFK